MKKTSGWVGSIVVVFSMLDFREALKEHLLDPLMHGVVNANVAASPYPRSPIIADMEWAPTTTVVRKAPGGDNWPMTWADDDAQYTAYGDGWGFKPLVNSKLSMGFSKIIGGPDDFHGVNIRSESGERIGQGPDGVKASGILYIDGVLYLWTRNADNSQLGWSVDKAATWTWCDWKFSESFGCPTFLNFGKNYAGARDDYVYIYSHDSNSAYEPADQMVMARVLKTRLKDRDAYEFFQKIDDNGDPFWSRDVENRGAVFSHKCRCYRSGITYNAGLKRYVWCQVLPGSKHAQGPRFEGGFGVYDAPQPWGPWSTAFFTEHWDMGPGESASFPTKWMSDDGKTLHLVFSGDDHFSVRRVTLRMSKR